MSRKQPDRRTERERSLVSFEEAWRRHADRPPETAPTEAARRITARLAPRRRCAPSPRWLAAAALLVLAVGLGLLLTIPQQEAPPAAAELATPPPLDEGVVLLWLDSDTPLYMTLTPPTARGEKGDPS